MNSVSHEAALAYPGGETHGSAIDRKHAVSAIIAALLKRGFPADIAGLVIAIIIDAAKGMLARWLQPNISKKPIERGPLGAYLDPAAAIPMESGNIWIFAALPHVLP